ncbi:MAG: hypothetical protein K8R99_12790 [Actinomycetia bacterium]|nr:hypothetical protein [Actinomycetes bacterium]
MRTRLLRLFASWILVAVGVPMLIEAELGVAPFDVFNTGVGHATGWSLGICFVVDAMIFFGIGIALGVRPGLGSVGGTVLIGPMINVVLSVIPKQHALFPRFALLIAGTLILAVAICLVVSTDLGAGPTEVVMLGLIHRGLGIVPARWISDGTPLVIGTLLGGAIGPGTLLFALSMGPMVKFGLRRLKYEPRRHVPLGTDAAFGV